MLTNKHIITALIVTPILALIAYFAVDLALSEKPKRAKPNNSYPLAAKSNCRYSSGQCSLVNGDIRIELSTSLAQLIVSSSHALEGLQLAVADSAQNERPLSASKDRARRWSAELPVTISDKSTLRIAASIAGSIYFKETSLAFLATEAGSKPGLTGLSR